jgi:hypothetical protein
VRRLAWDAGSGTAGDVKYLKSKIPGEQDIHRLGAQIRALPPQLESLTSYWLQKCAGREMPQRDELPVEELRPWLGHLALLELAGERDSRVRLCGSNLIRRFGREATGVRVGELAVDISRQLTAIVRATVKAMAPVVSLSSVQLGHTATVYCEVALPLGDANGRLAMVLLGSYPVRQP